MPTSLSKLIQRHLMQCAFFSLLCLAGGLITPSSSEAAAPRLRTTLDSPIAITDFGSVDKLEAFLSNLECDPGQLQPNPFIVGARIFGVPVRATVRLGIQCTEADGSKAFAFEDPVDAVVVGTTYGTCTTTAISNVKLVKNLAYVKVGCADNSGRILQFESDGSTGGTVTEAVRTGDSLSDGTTIDDFEIGFDARWDGQGSVLGFRYRDTLGRAGIAVSTQGTPFTHEVRARTDSLGGFFPRGVSLAYDCADDLAPGDPGCAIPANFEAYFGASATPFGAVTQFRNEGGLTMSVGDPAPGLPGEFFQTFFPNGDPRRDFSAHNVGIIFTATTNLGTSGVWEYREPSFAELIMSTGDPIPDTNKTALSFSQIASSIGSMSFMADDTIVTQVKGQLRGAVRRGVDKMDGLTIASSLANDSRSISGGFIAPVAQIGGNNHKLGLMDIERVDLPLTGPSLVYGADVGEGRAFEITKPHFNQRFAARALDPFPGGDLLRSMEIDLSGQIKFGGSLGQIYTYDISSGTFSSEDTMTSQTLVGLAVDANDDVFFTNGFSLYSVDPAGLGVLNGNIVDALGGFVPQIRGLAYDQQSGEVRGVNAGGQIGSFDTSTAVWTLIYDLAERPSELLVDSISFEDDAIWYGFANGVLGVAFPDDAFFEDGATIPSLPLRIVGQSGLNLAGIALEVPEPGFGWALGCGLMMMAILSGRSAPPHGSHPETRAIQNRP